MCARRKKVGHPVLSPYILYAATVINVYGYWFLLFQVSFMLASRIYGYSMMIGYVLYSCFYLEKGDDTHRPK
jgi:hypothetical protein